MNAPDWGDVLATALVGTQRRTLPAGVGRPGQDAAEALLDAAGALTLYRRAGFRARSGLTVPEAAPDDSDMPLVSWTAAARAADLLAVDAAGYGTSNAVPVRDADGRLELLYEWLSAARGRRVPGELLPALLEIGRRHRALRPLVAAAGGPRVAWLARQRPEWAYLDSSATGEIQGAADDPQGWELGTIGRRVGILTAVRRGGPAGEQRGRDMLADVWPTETPDDRAALLGTFATGLSPADEPVLEGALDDRRKEVRNVALDLLAMLPDSAYARRMIERTTAAVRVVDGRIHVEPPAACDKAMRRDGIVARPPAGVGERAWWLEELLTRTPLTVWGEPEEFLALPVTEEWVAVLRRGLARAAAGQRDPAWATALTGRLTEEVAAGGRPDDRLLLEALYDALPSDALSALAVAVLRRGLAGAAAVGVEHVLELCPRPWPEPLVEAVFAALDDLSGRRSAGWRLAGLCELAALRLPADTAARATTMAAALPSDDPMSSIVGRFADTLRFRDDMLAELR
ncbi:DUF5691 domain-containing protein [Dactylosporangium matsuzakiense]|uniref:Uncharacterized protein n=1 Tax=Dactylosporangium matsuzakiense TaxID=53360 RepID=A0A9W6KBP2_9ACTN|nr:DUF5691 domain-containing protein [Dactylosporangium matsuzakiense]UWZ44963.1 hypothetical protein Dmats_48005 [Dactylosporangium matsuzakiense]GLK99131.1 hypothetical protein GCM10017581_008720 [Dactylosporangium matsuzakiense]